MPFYDLKPLVSNQLQTGKVLFTHNESPQQQQGGVTVSQSDLSFKSEKIHLIFPSQNRLDKFCKNVLKEPAHKRYEECKKDDRKSSSLFVQEFLSDTLGLNLIHKDNTARGSSIEVDIIDNEFKLNHKRIEDSMCVMFFSDDDSIWLRASICSRLDHSIIVEFPSNAQEPSSLEGQKNLHLFNPGGEGEAEAKLCLAILHSITFVNIDTDLIESVEDILSEVFPQGGYDLVKDQHYTLTGTSMPIVTKWKNHIRRQKILLHGLKNRVMPYSPFSDAPRRRFHDWLNLHSEHLQTLDHPPSQRVQNSLNRITHLNRMARLIPQDSKSNSTLAYETMAKNDLFSIGPSPKDWGALHNRLIEIYRSNATKGHAIFSGIKNLQRLDKGFETYAKFADWTDKDREQLGLVNNLNPKFWRHFHILNLAHAMSEKYGERLESNPNSNQEMDRLKPTNVDGFNTHNSWIFIMKWFQEFSKAGGRLA
jgi:hypothetical protein